MVPTLYIADIGSDHGFVPRTLLEKNRIKHAFVTDISPKCLDKARDNLIYHSSSVTFALGDGLEVFSPDMLSNYRPITAVITGMGGEEIKRILSRAKVEFDYYLLGAQSNIFLLIDYLNVNKYEILLNKIVKEGKMFYNLLLVKHCDVVQNIDKPYLYFGEENIKTMPDDFADYVRFLLHRYEKIVKFDEKNEKNIEIYHILQNILGGKYV